MSLMSTYNEAGISSTKKKGEEEEEEEEEKREGGRGGGEGGGKGGRLYWRLELNSSHCSLNSIFKGIGLESEGSSELCYSRLSKRQRQRSTRRKEGKEQHLQHLVTDDTEMEEEKAQAGTLSCQHSTSEDPWKT